jgi:NTE family protein
MLSDGSSLGLALSGGGYRAALFGLGTLYRLNDSGLLGRLDRVTSVSGGSILAGVLMHRWERLTFVDGCATNFAQVIAAPVREFCSNTIDIGAGLKGILIPGKSAGEFLADRYAKDLFGKATLKDLPVAGPGVPKLIIYATNLQTGRSFRFRQDMIADYMLGTNAVAMVPLATAVAASSAFPPIFSPVVLATDSADWRTGSELHNLDSLRQRIVLADGGVYDNMGLESLVDNVDVALVSDAGAPFEIDETPHEDYLLQLGRVRDILIDQTRALRKRWLISEFDAGCKRGAYWGIGTQIDAYHAPLPLAADNLVTRALEHVSTRLSGCDPELQGHLINWGYSLCDAALRTRAALSVRLSSGHPVPEWPLF